MNESLQFQNNTQRARDFATEKFQEAGVGNHFVEVFDILHKQFGVTDEDTLVAALLHDTLEDTNTTPEEIASLFSEHIAHLVEEVSHPKNYTTEEKKSYYEKIKHISPEGKIIKLADFASHLPKFIGAFTGENTLPRFTHNEYCVFIREFLTHCPDSFAKTHVAELNETLDALIAGSKTI